MVISCDLITDVSLHHIADLHRTYDATVTMLLAPAPDTSDMASPGGKAGKKIGTALDAPTRDAWFPTSSGSLNFQLSYLTVKI